MFEVNIPKLRGKMAEKGYNKSRFAVACGIHRNTLNTYLKRPEKMTVSVIRIMADLLCDSPEEAANIFFSL